MSTSLGAVVNGPGKERALEYSEYQLEWIDLMSGAW